MTLSQMEELAREAQVVDHLAIAGVGPGPVQQQVRVHLEGVGPRRVFEKLLPHEQHATLVADGATFRVWAPNAIGVSEST